ncbi:unnamed protein product, partial [Litomosoides sigmodontis]
SLSNWVQCMILSKGTPVERAGMITKFIHVAKCAKLEIIPGAESIYTTSFFNIELCLLSQSIAQECGFLLHSNHLVIANGLSYRGVHLKDLISLLIKSEESSEHCCLVSCRQIPYLAIHLSYFVNFNRTPHNFPDANIDLIDTLKFPSTTKSVLFADWASGVSSALDAEIVNKHINAMVEAVFKNYDHNKDGSISQSEFQQISTNFPFIASFGTIDTDNPVNMRSDEIRIENFIKLALKVHLWGILRQGFKCHDCGLTVHRTCRDNVVVECRRTSNWKTTVTESAKITRKFLPSIGSLPRLRTTSTTLEHDEEDDIARASATCKIFSHLQPHLKMDCTRSDTGCYYQVTSSPESSHAEVVPSLACEEVFEDEFSCISISGMDRCKGKKLISYDLCLLISRCIIWADFVMLNDLNWGHFLPIQADDELVADRVCVKIDERLEEVRCVGPCLALNVTVSEDGNTRTIGSSGMLRDCQKKYYSRDSYNDEGNRRCRNRTVKIRQRVLHAEYCFCLGSYCNGDDDMLARSVSEFRKLSKYTKSGSSERSGSTTTKWSLYNDAKYLLAVCVVCWKLHSIIL